MLVNALCSQPGRLQQFVDDLYTGKLHREYHHGPDVSVWYKLQAVCPMHTEKERRD